MKLNRYFGIIFFVIIGCTNHDLSIKDLKIADSRYFYKETPFSGIAITKFDDGQISDKITFKNGVPNGYWVAYGYKGEIIQNGNFQPLDFNNKNVIGIGKIKRINICSEKEGDYTFTDVFIITDNSTLIANGKSAISKALADIISANNIKIDANKIHEIKCSKTEVE